MKKKVVNSKQAPEAIGPYSQAIKVGNLVYVSGQIPLHPETMEQVPGDFKASAIQVFENLKAVAIEAGGSLADVIKLNIFLTDMANYAKVNEIMQEYFQAPYPARAAMAVKELPKKVPVEVEAVIYLQD